MVLAYFGINVRGEIIIKEVKSNRSGTKIENILKTIKKYELKHQSGKISLEILKKYIKNNHPVIIPLQAWVNKKEVNWKNNWSDGHYVVAIGYDKNKIYFADPSSIYKTYLTSKELEERWHDLDDNGNKYLNYGIAIFGKKRKYSYNKVVHMD
jgi:ABC-type bacteriocin/lantibiotic exporter with double-glycine peptidase domain